MKRDDLGSNGLGASGSDGARDVAPGCDGPMCSCGCEMEHTRCDACEDGFTAPGELYEMDPLWYDEDDSEPCHQCNGRGGWWWCPACVEREEQQDAEREKERER
jgi:hypothetical protein